ncbi:hypothetical protein ACHHYP_00676 [Achlya hypogyna]|uniref:RING-type domain-containing protein n=1 Tax=Achlya hypogyna TaxID=1202772 RepID=A0A1V9ZU77_ACHHY|nr:hypothetical protein ACHHYP_00676 [Achlya hypogyna]
MGNVWSWGRATNEERVWEAARSGALPALKALEPTATTLNYRDAAQGRTPFTMACAGGHVAVARWLLDRGIDEYARDFAGNTPLHHACAAGQARVVRFLLELEGFSPYVLNAKGESPLEVARRTFVEREGDNDDLRLVSLAACIEQLEQRCSVFSGWLYHRVDTMLSSITGLSALQTWSRRYCIVLRTSSSMFLEVALFSMQDEGRRPPVPSSTVLVLVASDEPCIRAIERSFWTDLNPKPFSFELVGTYKSGASHTQKVRPFAFAALDAAGAAKWRQFFAVNSRSCLCDPLVPDNLQFNSHELGRARVFPTDCAPSAPPLEVEIATPVVFTKAVIRPECVVCFDGPQAAVCVPCGHNVLCMACATSLLATTRLCPVCRLGIREVVKVFRN